jgi:DNA modification methylase
LHRWLYCICSISFVATAPMTGDFQIYNEDWMTALMQIETGSVQCCVTSPPYWGLRDYGVKGQLGLEKTPEEYVGKLVAGFSLLRNALADDGILWLNLGDSYYGSGKESGQDEFTKNLGRRTLEYGGQVKNHSLAPHPSLKPKDLVGIPWMVAFALRTDGWYLRSDIIWQKPNPMPESVDDRPTKSHEHIFLLSKSATYYYDAEAIQEPVSDSYANDKRPLGVLRQRVNKNSKYPDEGQFKRMKNLEPDGQQPHTMHKRRAQGLPDIEYPKRNKRDVWTINTESYREAHFATFPEEIPRLCIAAGSKKGQIILDPFAGSGTTGEVALRMERKFIGIELNGIYTSKLIEPRLNNVTPLFRGAVATS